MYPSQNMKWQSMPKKNLVKRQPVKMESSLCTQNKNNKRVERKIFQNTVSWISPTYVLYPKYTGIVL